MIRALPLGTRGGCFVCVRMGLRMRLSQSYFFNSKLLNEQQTEVASYEVPHSQQYLIVKTTIMYVMNTKESCM
jgi:hypothetical protein